jgi:hypothetical protein
VAITLVELGMSLPGVRTGRNSVEVFVRPSMSSIARGTSTPER